MSRIVCVIPAYNEGKTIEVVVSKVRKHVDLVFVVDDGSLDATSEASQRAGAVVLRHQVNKGKGAALKTGFGHALQGREVDFVVSMDGDGEHNPNEIPRVLDPLLKGEADLVIGSRFKGSAHGLTLPRRLSNIITTWIIRHGFGVPVSDSQSGFRAFTRKILETVDFKEEHYSAESEILIKTHRLGFKITEVPINSTHKGSSSHFNSLLDTLRFLKIVITNL